MCVRVCVCECSTPAYGRTCVDLFVSVYHRAIARGRVLPGRTQVSGCERERE